MEIYVAICAIAFFAGFIQGLTGFGSVLLSLPLIALFLDFKTAVPFMTICGIALSLILIIQLRKAWEWSRIYPLLIGALPGIPIGTYLLKNLEAAPMYIFLGSVLIAYALFGIFSKGVVKELKKGWPYLIGFLAGCLGGAVAASGPPVIVYTFLQPWDKDRIKVTLQGFFVVSGLLTLAYFIHQGLVGQQVLKLSGLALPFIAAGTLAGSYFYGRLNEAGYRKLMYYTLAVLGIMMFAQGL
jgi:uncharacterized membrane protein YfcA